MGRGSAGTNQRRTELSDFLRTRRARLSPGEVGLAESGRRRTPGLRREEVAVLAGVGTSWYTWLEQGREIRVSASVARSTSRALRLTESERAYFYALLGLPDEPRRGGQATRRTDADLVRLADSWLPNPALLLDTFWNILAANQTAREAFGLADDHTNLLVSFFTDRHRRERYVEPEDTGRVAVAEFRGSMARHFHDPRFSALVGELCERSDEFAALWADHEVRTPEHRQKETIHPRVGRLCFSVHVWEQPHGDDNVRLFLYLPRPGTDTGTKIESLARRIPAQSTAPPI